VIGPHESVKLEVGDIGRGVEGRVDLFEDNITLFSYFFRFVLGTSQHIGEDFQRSIHVGVWYESAIVCMLVVGGCVEIATYTFDLFGDLGGIRSLVGALEDHVLDKVAHACQF